MSVPEFDALFTREGPARGCWAEFTSAELREDIEKLEARIDPNDASTWPVWKKVSDYFRTQHGLQRNPSSVARHFKRDCKCPKN